MRTTSGISASSMLRMVSSGSPIASSLTAAIAGVSRAGRCQRPRAQPRKFLARKLQIDPGFALLAGTAQQVGRMVGDNQGRRARSECMHLAAQTADRGFRGKQILRRNAADRENQPWPQQLQLA